MTVCTDDERREVARMLRELTGDSTYPDLIGVIADHDGWYPASDAADRLADLIEPSESGQNRDRNQDTVQKESPAVQMAPECDRDALLALADEMDAYSIQFGTGLQACTIQAWAFSIRESLGVSK